MYKVCIITQTHLVNNPRVVKEANALQKHGYDVEVLTVFSSFQKLIEDKKLNVTGFKYSPGVNLISRSQIQLSVLYYRLSKKLGDIAFRYLKISSPFNLMYGPYTMLSEALRRNADLYIGHTELGLWVCNQLANYNKNVAFDFEDWYSQDYINKYRPTKYLQLLEKTALGIGKYVTCPSHSMAFAIAQYYKSNNSLNVIYNGFSNLESSCIKIENNVDRSSSERITFVWFSQTIGPGRGLEMMIEALNSVSFEYELHLLGNCSADFEIKLINLHRPNRGQKLYIHSRIPHNKLITFISEHDVGLALEQDFPPSRNYTVTNKVLQYLQAGLTVISSRTSGQNEVALHCEKNVFLFNNNDSKELRDQLNKVYTLFKSSALNKNCSIFAFENYFSWEKQESKLLELVGRVLK